MTWPPQSPNLNPVEMVWDELGHRVKEKQSPSAQHLWELQGKAVIKTKGGYFEEYKI